MIRDYIANNQSFKELKKFQPVLEKIIPFLPEKFNLCMENAAKNGNRQGVLDFLVGESPAMHALRQDIRINAPGDHNILITGSSGTGKELVAMALHCLSPRFARPFVTLNCATLGDRYDSDLYGHEKGAFTGAYAQHKGAFERADGGTLFLDEIGELPFAVQAGMLRALQERTIIRVGGKTLLPVNCRIILATNINLDEAVGRGQFRRDMYFRLIEGACIHSPDLADRADDFIPLTLCQIIRHMKKTMDHQGEAGGSNGPITIHQSYFKAMNFHNFEGNIRELEGIVKRTMLYRKSDTLTDEDFLRNAHPLARYARNRYRQPPDQGSVEQLLRLLAGKAGIDESSKVHIARVIVSFGNTAFSPKSFIEKMKTVHPLHDNTCRKYLRYLHKWAILQHNNRMTSGSLYSWHTSDFDSN